MLRRASDPRPLPPCPQTILTRVTQEGMRPEFPRSCPASYSSLAKRCWQADPTQRPTFAEIVTELRAMQQGLAAAAIASASGATPIPGGGGLAQRTLSSGSHGGAAPLGHSHRSGSGQQLRPLPSPSKIHASGSGGYSVRGSRLAPSGGSPTELASRATKEDI